MTSDVHYFVFKFKLLCWFSWYLPSWSVGQEIIPNEMLISSDVFYLGSDRLQQSDVKLLLYCTAVYKFPDLLQFYFIEKKMY